MKYQHLHDSNRVTQQNQSYYIYVFVSWTCEVFIKFLVFYQFIYLCWWSCCCCSCFFSISWQINFEWCVLCTVHCVFCVVFNAMYYRLESKSWFKEGLLLKVDLLYSLVWQCCFKPQVQFWMIAVSLWNTDSEKPISFSFSFPILFVSSQAE